MNYTALLVISDQSASLILVMGRIGGSGFCPFLLAFRM